MLRNNKDRVLNFTWRFKEDEEEKMANLILKFEGALNCSLNMYQTNDNIMVLNVTIVIP